MKKYIAFICAFIILLLTACNNQTTPHTQTPADDPTQSEQPAKSPETTTSAKDEQPTQSHETATTAEEKNSIDTMEKLSEVDGVISVTKQAFSKLIKGAIAYKVLYESANGKLAADVVLPNDYTNKNKHYTVLIYFPEVGTYIETLASNYALNNIILIRPYARGYDESEG